MVKVKTPPRSLEDCITSSINRIKTLRQWEDFVEAGKLEGEIEEAKSTLAWSKSLASIIDYLNELGDILKETTDAKR